ncbi:MAG: hypothetical protein RI564_07495 [Gracilimonas sp.]|nr:hypothetical protein [Gracilimonas sp.]
MERVVHIAKSHAEARERDIEQALAMTLEERQTIAKELKKRAFGNDAPDVKQAHRGKINQEKF